MTETDHMTLHMIIQRGDHIAMLIDPDGDKRPIFPYAKLAMPRLVFLASTTLKPFADGREYGFTWLGGSSSDQFVILHEDEATISDETFKQAYPDRTISWTTVGEASTDPTYMMLSLYACHQTNVALKRRPLSEIASMQS